MTALADLSDIVNRCTGGSSGTPELLFFYRDSRVGAGAAAATVAGRMTSLWRYEGSPAGGAAPGGVMNPNNTTDGGLKQANPGGGRQKWLIGATAVASASGTLILYDRLLSISGLSGTTTTAQTVGGSLTRYTGAASVGNMIMIEVYTAIGGTATTITAAYTDQDNNSATSTATGIGGTGLSEAQRAIVLPLATGGTGVRAVASVTLAASTGTAGNFGVNIIRPLLVIPVPISGAGVSRNLIAENPGPIEIQTGACLSFMFLANGTTAPQVFGTLSMIEA
jgi:hypothetical protein